MFRFTIRDVLWLMVVVAIGCGWWRSTCKNLALREALQAALGAAGSRSITLRDGEFVDGFNYGRFGRNDGGVEIRIDKIEPNP